MKRIFSHACSQCREYTFNFHESSHTDTLYQWVCDNCGVQMSLRFYNGGQQVEQTPTGKRCERTLALLQLRENKKFMFIYEGCAWDGDMSGHEYFYHEHTCPTNLMKCEKIIVDGELDPHGIFEIVEEHLITGPNAKARNEVLVRLVALAVEKTRRPS